MDRLESSEDRRGLNIGGLPVRPVKGRCEQGSGSNRSTEQHEQGKIVLLEIGKLEN